MQNFYPDQYNKDKNFSIQHNYLSSQFSDSDLILSKIKNVVINNDFTLGNVVDEVEELIAHEANTKYAVAVGSGTDALFLSLKSLGIGQGDEVITTTFTFYATIGAIVTAGARPVFCDCSNDYNINANLIESLITPRTKAIMPVHWSGRPCDMNMVSEIARSYNLSIVEDACHALQADYRGKRCGSLGDLGCFSFHPLKNLNVWGDGGIITTNNENLSRRLKLIRNHGLIDRDTCVEFSYNSRLDTIQAVVAKHVLEHKFNNITKKRIYNSHLLDVLLSEIPELVLPKRDPNLKEVFHLYMFQALRRDELIAHLQSFGIDAKVHYPVNMHLQPAASFLGHKIGDFPIAEKLSNGCVSLPVHEFVSEDSLEYMSSCIKSFYASKS